MISKHEEYRSPEIEVIMAENCNPFLAASTNEPWDDSDDHSGDFTGGSVLSSLAMICATTLMLGAAASCTKEQSNPQPADDTVTIRAEIAGNAVKTAFDESSRKAFWAEGDKVNINGTDYTVSSFGSDVTTFENVTAAENYTAYYPASICSTGAPLLPAIQNYDADPVRNAPMYARSTTGELSFKNITGVFRLTLKGTATIKSIVLVADQPLCGPFTVVDNAAVISDKATPRSVTVSCGEGVTLTEAGVTFNVAIPAGTYTNLRVAVNDNAFKYQILRASAFTVARGKFETATLRVADFVEQTDLSATATANTYMIHNAGHYMFDATVKGNGGLDPLTGAKASTIDPAGIAGAKVLWELYGKGRAIALDNDSYNISYSDGYVHFSTPETFVEGDACVAVFDSEGRILWSWLIWATDAPGTMEYGGKTFMGRNLGAINAGNCMRGFLYEWGRKDPYSAANGGYDVYPYAPAASTVFSHINGPASIEFSIANPTVYVRRSSDSNPSWMDEAGYTAIPWRDDVKTIYDPCPAGWRVPRKGDLNSYGSYPNTGLTNGYDKNESYKGFGNPGTGYCWYSTTNPSEHKQKAYAFVNDSRKGSPQFWGHDQGYSIRPLQE